MKKILVTGGAGFIGSNLIKRLLKDNHIITSVDNYSAGKKENEYPGVKYLNLNTSEIPFEKYDVVFHLGEYSRIATSFEDIESVWESNSVGTFKVLEMCKKYNTKIVYAGSSTRFASEGISHSPYSFFKAQSAALVKNYHDWYGLPYSICYFYNVFGPGYDSSPKPGYESVVSVFEKQWKKGLPLTICGDGSQTRSFTYVDDIVEGLIMAWKSEECLELQLSNPKQFSILEIAKMFSDNIKHIDPRPGDRRASAVNDNTARDKLNWKTTMCVSEWIKNIKK